MSITKGTTGGNGQDLPPPNSERLTSSVVSRFRLTAANTVTESRGVITTTKIMKPRAEAYIRTHPDPLQELPVYIFDQRDGAIPIAPEVFDAIKAKVPDFHKFAPCVTLRTYMTKLGGVYLWPLKMESPTSFGNNSYNLSALAISDRTRKEWLRMSSIEGEYRAIEPDERIPEPDWSKVPDIEALFEMVTKGQAIDGPDHPLIRPLRGG